MSEFSLSDYDNSGVEAQRYDDGVIIIQGNGMFHNGDPLVGIYVTLDMEKMQVEVSTTKSIKIFGENETLREDYLDQSFAITLSDRPIERLVPEVDDDSKQIREYEDNGALLHVTDTEDSATGVVQLAFPGQNEDSVIIQLGAKAFNIFVRSQEDGKVVSTGKVAFENPALNQFKALDGVHQHLDPGLQKDI